MWTLEGVDRLPGSQRKNRARFLTSSLSSSGTGKDGPGAALIVEDNIVIAMAIEAHLEDYGIATCLITGTVETALMLLKARPIAFAILDVDLGNESSEEVALALQQRGLPFAFMSGYADEMPLLQRFPDVPALAKPFEPDVLYAVLKQLGIG